MGFGYGTRSAEDLQRDNRQIYSFAKIKERYEQTIPLRGKRAKLNIRPHGQRDRSWERIVKVNENEYYLTNIHFSKETINNFKYINNFYEIFYLTDYKIVIYKYLV